MDLTVLVKTMSQENYDLALDRLRAQFHGDAKRSSYLEDNIHGKRCLFANHITQSYPGNLHRQGNAIAESNHSSILSRLSGLVQTPVRLVQSMIQRHADMSAERNNFLATHHLKCVALSRKAKDRREEQAVLSLSSSGFIWHRKAVKSATYLNMTVNPDGSRTFTSKTNPDAQSFWLPAGNVSSCTCSRCVALAEAQCCHLILTRGGFSLELWGKRWHQRTRLGSIVRGEDNGPDDVAPANGRSDFDDCASMQTESIALSQNMSQNSVGLSRNSFHAQLQIQHP